MGPVVDVLLPCRELWCVIYCYRIWASVTIELHNNDTLYRSLQYFRYCLSLPTDKCVQSIKPWREKQNSIHLLKCSANFSKRGSATFLSVYIYTHRHLRIQYVWVFEDTTCLTLYPAILWLLDLFTCLFRENAKRTSDDTVITLHPSFKQTHEARDDCHNQVFGCCRKHNTKELELAGLVVDLNTEENHKAPKKHPEEPDRLAARWLMCRV